jgi:Uncharacterised protein family (UPF0259)
MSTIPPQPARPAGPPAKLDTAAVFERIFEFYGSQFTTLIGLALVVFVPVALLQGIVAASGSLALLFATTVLALVGQALYTGAVVDAVADLRDGRRDFSVGMLLQRAVPFIFPLIGAGILFGLIVALGFVLLIVPGLVFLTWFALFGPAIVVERQGVFAAFTRSRDLVRGNGWRVFGVLVVTVIIVAVIGSIISQIAYGISEDFVGALVGNLISNLITAPIFAITVSTLFFMLRGDEPPAAA